MKSGSFQSVLALLNFDVFLFFKGDTGFCLGIFTPNFETNVAALDGQSFIFKFYIGYWFLETHQFTI